MVPGQLKYSPTYIYYIYYNFYIINNYDGPVHSAAISCSCCHTINNVSTLELLHSLPGVGPGKNVNTHPALLTFRKYCNLGMKKSCATGR